MGAVLQLIENILKWYQRKKKGGIPLTDFNIASGKRNISYMLIHKKLCIDLFNLEKGKHIFLIIPKIFI